MVLGLSGFMRLFKMCSSWASCLRVVGVGPSSLGCGAGRRKP